MPSITTQIEYTLLKPDTTITDVKRICEEAANRGYAGVCIPPLYVREARRVIGDNKAINLVTVIGYPMGYSALPAKSEEIKRAADEDADHIEGMINLAAIKSGNWNHVANDINGMNLATRMRGKTMKINLECSLLTTDELRRICEITAEAGIKWLKTGTGFYGDTTPEMVASLRRIAPSDIRIKAECREIKAQAVQALLDAGADRVGLNQLLT